MDLKKTLGTLLLSLGVALPCSAQEVSLSLDKFFLSGKEEVSTTSAQVSTDNWSIFSQQANMDMTYSSTDIFVVGGTCDLWKGVLSASVKQTDASHLLFDESSFLTSLSYELFGLEAVVGIGDGKFLRGAWNVNHHLNVWMQYVDGLTQLDVRDPLEQMNAVPQTYFFSLLPTRADVPGVLWDTKFTGPGMGVRYKGKRHDVSLEYNDGERPFLGFGDPGSFSLIKLNHKYDGVFYDYVDVEVGKGEYLYETHIDMELGIKKPSWSVAFSGYMHGIADSLTRLAQYYNGAGVGFTGMLDFGVLEVGAMASFEKDRVVGKDTAQAALVAQYKNHFLLLGPTFSEGVHEFFANPSYGFIIATAHDIKKWQIKASYVDDGYDTSGSLQLRYKFK